MNRNKLLKWTIPAALAAGAILLSWGLQWMVPDYKNKIRPVEYEANPIVSLAEQEDEIELYPWSEFQADESDPIQEWERDWVVLPETGIILLEELLKELYDSGFLKDPEAVYEQIEAIALFDPNQGRIYVRNISMETVSGEYLLNAAWSYNGLEYMDISPAENQNLSGEEADAFCTELQRMLEEFQKIRISVEDSGYKMAVGYDGYDVYEPPLEEILDVPEDWEQNVFREFIEDISNWSEMCGIDIIYPLEELVFAYPCEMIPYQGKILLVFSGEYEQMEAILIYNPAMGRISGYSLRC